MPFLFMKPEDVLNAAVHVSLVTARIVVRQGDNHTLAEANTTEHLLAVLEPVIAHDGLRNVYADALSVSAYEMEREVGDDDRPEIPPITEEAKRYLHGLLVIHAPQEVPQYRCCICGGEAETRAGAEDMHDPICPLHGFRGIASGEGEAPPPPLPEIL